MGLDREGPWRPQERLDLTFTPGKSLEGFEQKMICFGLLFFFFRGAWRLKEFYYLFIWRKCE